MSSRDASRWFALAVGSLAVAGAFSLVLVLGRIPLRAVTLVADPTLAQRSLVVHVNLAMGVWFLACIAGLFCLLPGGGRWRPAPWAVAIALLGVVMVIVSAFVPTAAPIMSNYVPALDHPLFLAGLTAFAAGVLLNFADHRLLRAGSPTSDMPIAAQYALRAAAVVFVAALLTIGGARATQVQDVSRTAYYERLFWGGGHVLQTVNTLGMIAAWLILLHRLTGRETVGERWTVVLFGIVTLPTLVGPWLTIAGRSGEWFTRMMQYGIFPVVLVFAISGARALWTGRHRLDPVQRHTPALIGLMTSIAMTLVGFVLGAMIVGDTTLTPAHYHANIGAVTVALMTVLMVLQLAPDESQRWSGLIRWQPLVYGTGQMLFVLGLAIAGTLGQAPRKAYGPEQHVRTSAERIGLMIGVGGGVLALGGGLLFVALMARPRSKGATGQVRH